MPPEQTHIDLPEDVSREQAADLARSFLAEHGVQSIETREEREGDNRYTVIRGETEPSLFSWGEEIEFRVFTDRIDIESKAPSQLITWGKPQKNIDSASTYFQEKTRA